MTKLISALALLAILVITNVGSVTLASASSTSPEPRSSPALVVDPDVVAKAKEWYHRFRTGNIDRRELSGSVNAQLTDPMIRKEAAKLMTLGTPTSFTLLRMYSIAGATGYDFLLKFRTARVVEMIAFYPDGKIAGIDFQTYIHK